MKKAFFNSAAAVIAAAAVAGCNSGPSTTQQQDKSADTASRYLSKPLVSHMYTADPSAHVFNGKIYIYPSHDIDAGTPEKDDGSHFAMRDYHILSMESTNGPVQDNGVALDIKDI